MPNSRKRSAASPAPAEAARRIDDACRQAVLGKLAARSIARWLSGFELGEVEFRLLWLLHTDGSRGAETKASAAEWDQAALAERLAVSPAQISAVVDRLRSADRLAAVVPAGDRRRQLWRLTPSGRALVQSVVAAVGAAPEADGRREVA
jgi:DNA-binding MarR family transcriptional regulator